MTSTSSAEPSTGSAAVISSRSEFGPGHPDYRPPRGYKWAPFQPGHTLTLTHGARSPRVLEPLAASFIESVSESVTYLGDPSYRPAVERWAVAEARALLYERWLLDHEDLENPDGLEWCRNELHRWQKRASDEADRLGLTPLARARLGKDVAATKVDIARLWAELGDEST